MNYSEIRAAARSAMKPHFANLLLTLVLETLLLVVASSIPVVGFLLVAGPLTVGSAIVFYNAVLGQQTNISSLFDGFRYHFGETFLMALLKFIFVFLWSLLLLIPGIVKSYSYAMSAYIMMREPNISGMEALSRSKELMEGYRFSLFLLQLSFIGWLLLCVITFGLAVIYVAPYMKTAETIFFSGIYDAAVANN